MAIGILHASVRSEQDAPIALLSEYVENNSLHLKTSAIVGYVFSPLLFISRIHLNRLFTHTLDIPSTNSPKKTSLGLAYAGSHREDIYELLSPLIADDSNSMEILALAALSLGFVFAGSANGEIAGTILQVIMEKLPEEDEEGGSGSAKGKDELSEKWARFLTLGLALLYIGTCFIP